MFEVLMFLFENYMGETISLRSDEATITFELEQIGFSRHEIHRALNWLTGLNQFQASFRPYSLSSPSFRYYLPEENERLGLKGREFLSRLEKIGILDLTIRETVIDRVMALDIQEVDFFRIRWVVLMVLFGYPEKRNALCLLQNMILAENLNVWH